MNKDVDDCDDFVPNVGSFENPDEDIEAIGLSLFESGDGFLPMLGNLNLGSRRLTAVNMEIPHQKYCCEYRDTSG